MSKTISQKRIKTMKNIYYSAKDHQEAIESYHNGNISDFKVYIKELSSIQLLELLEIFIEYGYSLNKLRWLLDG